MSFQSSTIVPAADGHVKYKKTKNNNYEINLKVLHLASADKLSPARSTYVVWMETDDNGIKNLGQLRSSSSLISSTMKATLKTVSPFKPERFFITAEDDARISVPGNQIVLRTQ